MQHAPRPAPPPPRRPRPARAPIPAAIGAAIGALRSLLLAGLLGAVAPPPAEAAPAPKPRPVAAEAEAPAAPAAPARPGAAGAERAEADLFAMPHVAAESRRAFALAAAGDPAGAAALLDALLARHPGLGRLHADRAALAMLEGAAEAALAHLEAAVRHGLPDPAAVVRDPVFAPLARDPAARARLEALAARPPAPAPLPIPLPVRAGRAEVTAANTRWNPATERLEPRFAFPAAPAAPAPLPDAAGAAAHELLREHWRAGRAAGNHGDLYDNRDRGHSALELARFPQLTAVTYAAAARAADLDYGLGDRLLFDHVTFGNSSTAIRGGPHWRSLPRLALTRPDGTGPMRLWQNWAANHLYVYPSHRDFGPERGDLFPANTPYLVVARGASGADRPFLEAIAMILASFPPKTKARLIEANLVVPTVQFVLRRSLQDVRGREAYLSGAAHPAAFDRRSLNLARMVSLANAIEPDAIPAEARIAVLEEELGVEGRDFFGAGLSERLFDTPSAVARIWRGHTGRRTMLVSAEASRDANGRPLTFHWRLLQGDPARVRIEPEADGARARITIDWHDPFPVPGAGAGDEAGILTARVDIGLFAANGAHDSAPAILSWYFPPHETRHYETGADGVPRIAAIDHADPAKAHVYADPLLFPRAAWRDVYAWDAAGNLAGWTRHRAGSAGAAAYDAAGRRLEAGGPRPVAYPLRPAADGTFTVEETPPPPLPAPLP